MGAFREPITFLSTVEFRAQSLSAGDSKKVGAEKPLNHFFRNGLQ
jgi:hypothetical protein